VVDLVPTKMVVPVVLAVKREDAKAASVRVVNCILRDFCSFSTRLVIAIRNTGYDIKKKLTNFLAVKRKVL
jgi:hypothetical protein